MHHKMMPHHKSCLRTPPWLKSKRLNSSNNFLPHRKSRSNYRSMRLYLSIQIRCVLSCPLIFEKLSQITLKNSKNLNRVKGSWEKIVTSNLIRNRKIKMSLKSQEGRKWTEDPCFVGPFYTKVLCKNLAFLRNKNKKLNSISITGSLTSQHYLKFQSITSQSRSKNLRKQCISVDKLLRNTNCKVSRRTTVFTSWASIALALTSTSPKARIQRLESR